MDAFTRAISALLQLVVEIGNLLVAAIVVVELWLRSQLAAFGLPPGIQTLLLIAFTVLLIVVTLRLFGGLIRAVVILLLLLIVAHIIWPILPH